MNWQLEYTRDTHALLFRVYQTSISITLSVATEASWFHSTPSTAHSALAHVVQHVPFHHMDVTTKLLYDGQWRTCARQRGTADLIQPLLEDFGIRHTR